MITISQKGDFSKTAKFLQNAMEFRIEHLLEKYGRAGVDALADATPVDTGKTAASWNYEIESGSGYYRITWTNSNVNKYVNIALILQTGHGTRNGGYVQGRDYINPAIQPIFDELAQKAWLEVTKS